MLPLTRRAHPAYGGRTPAAHLGQDGASCQPHASEPACLLNVAGACVEAGLIAGNGKATARLSCGSMRLPRMGHHCHMLLKQSARVAQYAECDKRMEFPSRRRLKTIFWVNQEMTRT